MFMCCSICVVFYKRKTKGYVLFLLELGSIVLSSGLFISLKVSVVFKFPKGLVFQCLLRLPSKTFMQSLVVIEHRDLY